MYDPRDQGSPQGQGYTISKWYLKLYDRFEGEGKQRVKEVYSQALGHIDDRMTGTEDQANQTRGKRSVELQVGPKIGEGFQERMLHGTE